MTQKKTKKPAPKPKPKTQKKPTAKTKTMRAPKTTSTPVENKRERGVSKVQKWGGVSLAVTIPRSVVESLKLKQGDHVRVGFAEDGLTITKA